MRTTRFIPALIALAVFGFPRLAHAEDAEAAARRGTRLYEEGKYEEAAEAFRRARELAQREGELPPAFDYNLGTAYARQGEFDRAVETLREAASLPEPEKTPSVRERAWYNLGVSSARKAEALRQQGEGQLDAEYETLKQALDAFRQSLILDPSEESARHNYALTQQRLKELESQMQQQQEQQQQQGDGESSEGQDSDGQEQEQQEPGQGESGDHEESSSSEASPDSEGSDASQEGESQEPGEDEPPSPESPQPHQEASRENGDGQPREGQDAGPSRESEEDPPASSEQQQRGGLEATPTPTPTPGVSQASAPSRRGEQASGPSGDPNRPPSAASGSGGEDEPTPEQLDALRVLNSLEEGQPEQFKKLFRFRGGEGRDRERDW